MLAQTAFAEHVEESLLDITAPPAADMLEIAQSFQATTKVAFESGHRLNSGQQQLTYVEETGAKAGRKGELTIPQTFELALAPFEGSATYKVSARLRYRIGDGQLRIGYFLDRPEEVLRSAFIDTLTAIEAGVGGKALRGTPA